jgi:N-acetylglucosamine-6-phosphate deacetylase
MKIIIKNSYIYDSYGECFRAGDLLISGDRIAAVGRFDTDADLTLDAEGAFLLPGFVDVHTHGRDGYDFTDADETAMRIMAQGYLKNGTTTLMPTLASAPSVESLASASDKINAVKGSTGGASFAGVHLEGRYLNPEKRGAHATEYLAPLDGAEIKRLIPHLGEHFHVSCAAELDLSGEFLKAIREAGGTVGLGHTSATYREAMQAIENGVISFTHTFNAMPHLHHREGGAVSAALTSDAYAELIVDGIHIAPEMVRLAYRCKGARRLVLITDSMQATDCADGTYSIAGMTCIVKDGKAMTTDGHLAGSTLSLIDGLRNLMRFCAISLDEALPTVTLTPAEMMRLDPVCGSLEVGKKADFLILDSDFFSVKKQIDTVVLCGEMIDLK